MCGGAHGPGRSRRETDARTGLPTPALRMHDAVMDLSLAPEQVAHYQEHGWLVVRGACGPDEVEVLRGAWELLLGRFPSAVMDLTGDGVHQLASPCRIDPTLGRLLDDGVLGAAAATLLACDAVRLLQDVALMKPPRVGGRIGWHQDHDYAAYLTPVRTLAARIALDPEDADSGAMAVISGSHRWDVRLRVAERNWFIEDGALETLAPALRAQVEARRVLLALAPGDVSFHHCLTLHGSGPNRSERPRRTLGFHLFDGACRLDVEGLRDPAHAAFFETDDEGHLVGQRFPRLWPTR